jgi:hypothetical protein
MISGEVNEGAVVYKASATAVRKALNVEELHVLLSCKDNTYISDLISPTSTGEVAIKLLSMLAVF